MTEIGAEGWEVGELGGPGALVSLVPSEAPGVGRVGGDSWASLLVDTVFMSVGPGEEGDAGTLVRSVGAGGERREGGEAEAELSA